MSGQPTSDTPAFYAFRPAMIFAAATLVAFGVLIATVAIDRGRRTQLETVQERTAVGDRNYVTLPEPPQKPAGPLAIYQGKELHAAGKMEMRDVRMVRAGQDDSGRFTLYRGRDKDFKDSDGERVGDALFLKVGQDQYVRVKAAEAANVR